MQENQVSNEPITQTDTDNELLRDDAVITISRHTFNYFVIAVAFFVVGGIVGAAGYAKLQASTDEAIQKAVDAAFSRQEETISDLIASSDLSSSDTPEASQYVDDDPSIGPADAPVVIVEFSDFNCSYCKRFHDTTLQPLLDQYQGQIQFVYRDFAILGQTSVTSAMAAECADDQGKFWEYHDLLFANQPNFDRDSLIQYANELSLDTEQFTSCFDDQTYLEDVRADSTAAQEIGAQGTPAFLINGQFVSGAQPYDAFVQIIDSELAKATN